MNLVLEYNSSCVDKTIICSSDQFSFIMTPSINGNEDWLFRVKVSDKQAIISFPKLSTLGVGFAQENKDWNRNLPCTCETQTVWNHIKGNKGDDSISDQDCVEAIKIVCEASRQYLETDKNK